MNHNSKESVIQLQQKIIHYRSEASTIRSKLIDVQKKLEKEELRNRILKQKLFEAENQNFETNYKQINELEDKLQRYEIELEEEREKFSKLKKQLLSTNPPIPEATNNQTAEILPYFTYSTILPQTDTPEDEIMILGNFIIKNSGTIPLHNIVICIKISPVNISTLSGKIQSNSNQNSDPFTEYETAEEWKYIHEDWKERTKENGEHWLKPLHISSIEPGEQITFSNFDIRLTKTEHRSVVIDGYSYCEEIREGIGSINKIILNF